MSFELYTPKELDKKTIDILDRAQPINSWPQEIPKGKKVIFVGQTVSRRAFGKEIIPIPRASIFNHYKELIGNDKAEGNFLLVNEGQIPSSRLTKKLKQIPQLPKK